MLTSGATAQEELNRLQALADITQISIAGYVQAFRQQIKTKQAPASAR